MNVYPDKQKFTQSIITFIAMSLMAGCHLSRPPSAVVTGKATTSGDMASKNRVSNEETVKAAKSYVAGDLPGATKHYREALRYDPGNAMLKYQLAVNLMWEKKVTEALPLFREASLSNDKAVSNAAKIRLSQLEKKRNSKLK